MNAITAPSSFEDRLLEKVRTDIGQLMTDEELKQLVTKAIEKLYFTPQLSKPTSSWDSPKVLTNGALLAVVEPLIEKQVKVHVAAYLEANKDQIGKIIQEQIAQGFTKMVAGYIDSKLGSAFYAFTNDLQNRGFIK